ncbi:hypothetical protein M5689_015053 [Euphorbia peplus]|nr:hypothetical protein M5689_015053 [Euphorbia peplus]
MAELQSLPYTSWDLQNLGFLNSDMSLVMDGTSSSPFFSSLQSDFSTGYLEDALLEFNERSKRRRFVICNNDDDDQTKISKDLAQSYWNENCAWDINSDPGNFSCMSHITSVPGVSDEMMSRSTSNTSEEVNAITEIKTPENEEISVHEATTIDSSSSSYKDTAKTKSMFDKDTLPYSAAGDQDRKRKRRVIKRVVYPFALIKPGGIEGDMTINDINRRILMPPTRPVRHPVGDFACRPIVSATGPGLSGKAVVALTRIHTQGRGTITIIRTKG